METKLRVDLPDQLPAHVANHVSQLLGRADALRTAAGGDADSPLARAAGRYEAQINGLCNGQVPTDISYGQGSSVSIITEKKVLPNGVARQTQVIAVKKADPRLVYDGRGVTVRREYVPPAKSQSIKEYADATADERVRREATPIREPFFGQTRNAATAIGNAVAGLLGLYGAEIQPPVTLEDTRRAAEMTREEIHGEVTRNLAPRVHPADISDAEARLLIDDAYDAADRSNAAAYAHVKADIAVVPTDTGFSAVSTSAAQDCAAYYRAAGATNDQIREFIGPEAASLIGL